MTDMLLYQILAYTICRTKVRTSYKNKIFKVSVRIWNEKFQLSDGSYYLSDIQDCSATDAIRIISKIAIQKTADETGDLIGHKSADKFKTVWRTSLGNSSATVTDEIENIEYDKKYLKRNIYLHKKERKLLMICD